MNKDTQFTETITIAKFKNGTKIKFMSFTVATSEKSDLTKMVMGLLITIAEKKGYSTYFDSNSVDTLLNQFTDQKLKQLSHE